MTNNLKHIIMPDGTRLDLPTGSTGGSSKIGDIGVAPYVDETTNERRRLNGQVLIKDQYPAFVSWLTNLQATTPSLFATEDEWQAIKTASRLGQCGKFVIGDTTIRLPQIININGLVDMSNAGLIKDESLPDPNSKLYSIWGGGTGTGGNQSLIAQNYSGSIQSTPSTGHTYIKVDNSTYKNGAPVQQEAIQYPFYITVNTGSETTKPTISDYTVTTAYQYGMSQYYKGIMNSGAWLRSNGQMNPKATYEGLYNWALTQLNAGVEGFKSSTASDITDYDFVINQTDETFRLPLKNGMEGVFASGVKGNDYGLQFTDGIKTFGVQNSYVTNSNLPQFVKDAQHVGGIATGGVLENINTVIGLTTDSTKSGIVVDITVPSGYNLYYYCGNVEENPQLVNVARIEEALVDKTSMIQASLASAPSDVYDDLTLLASGQPYTAPETGWFFLDKIAGSAGAFVSITNNSTDLSSINTGYSSTRACKAMLKVAKGDTVKVEYTATGNTRFFRFYYDIGASSVSPDKAIANHLDTINGEVI